MATLAEIVADAGLNATPLWTDDCSHADPLAAGKWSVAPVQTVDVTGESIQYPQTLSSPHAMETSPAPRFDQTGSGGASGGGRYRFFAPSGDDIFSSGGRGRASLDYPRFNPGSSPPHIGPEDGSDNIGFFYEGRRAVTAFSTRLPSAAGFDLDPPIDWRVLTQWKRNEWYTVTDPSDSPALDIEQKNGLYMMRNLGVTEPLWEVDATGTLDDWIRWAVDITFSQDTGTGRFRVHIDFDNDGDYEYTGEEITGVQTLSSGSEVVEGGLDGPVAARFPAGGIESFFSWGMYEADGGDSIDFSDGAIYGGEAGDDGGDGGDGTPAGSVVWFPTATEADGGWTNADNAFAEDGVFATITTADPVEIRFTDFTGEAIPDGAAIDSVHLVYDRQVGSTAGGPLILATLYAAATELPSATEEEVLDTALLPFDTDYTDDAAWDIGLLEGAFVILRVRNVDGADPETAWSLDDVHLEIDYGAVDGGGDGGDGGDDDGTVDVAPQKRIVVRTPARKRIVARL